jgi:hypothetical protein
MYDLDSVCFVLIWVKEQPYDHNACFFFTAQHYLDKVPIFIGCNEIFSSVASVDAAFLVYHYFL